MEQLREAPCGLHLVHGRVTRCPVCARITEVNNASASQVGAVAGRARIPGKFQPSQPDEDASGVRRAKKR